MEYGDILRIMMYGLIVYGLIQSIINMKRKSRDSRSVSEIIFVIIFTLVMLIASIYYFMERGVALLSVLALVAFIAGINMIWKAVKRKPTINLEKIKQQMLDLNMDNAFVDEVISFLRQGEERVGQERFQQWLHEADYSIPLELQRDERWIELYDRHQEQIEEEVKKLEVETKLPWQEQTEDVSELEEKARKVVLVVRHRVSGAILELRDR